ncbi:VOC family protein [Dictyobacter arantiisoli]|uniref:Glyoxalase n=1 Tax=Dictyobacter arantiisoli TaxID=2014874 RepID=A0A5A5TEZ8_9CHLR|nr:VOC family protein [Dictyobacter arantiisoli]GCF10141.1 glyoxalase [Dictyobacter arantiisoli]
MAKILGPDFIGLQVRNLEASRTFYVELLGLEPTPQSPPHAIVFRTQPIPFAIREPVVNLDEVSHLGWGVVLWLQCDHADELCASLEGHGVPIVQRPFDGPFGRTFSFVDPDGYTITVHGA